MNHQKFSPLISRAQKYGSILGLDTIKALLSELGRPEKKLRVIHIAGTNGKGSIASFCQGILMENGYRIGLFTSPYFEDPREMIQYNREPIPQKDFEHSLKEVEDAVEKILQRRSPHPTEFEIYVALAFVYFARRPLDFVILEVGLGGREDATNVIEKPVLSIISQIGLDHTRFLGNTLKEIAYHKGGIIKKSSPVVVSPQEQEVNEVLQHIACSLKSPLYSLDPERVFLHNSSLTEQCFSVDFTPLPPVHFSKMKIQLSGKHQVFNGATALLAMAVLEERRVISLASHKTIKGLFDTQWPGRMEILGLHPLTVIDGAHNVAAAKSLAHTLKAHCGGYSITLILAMLEDKDVDGFLSEVIPLVNRVVVTKPLNPRGMDPVKLKEKLQRYPVEIMVEPSIPKAGLKALESTASKDMILAVGSLYMIGKAREVFLEHFNTP